MRPVSADQARLGGVAGASLMGSSGLFSGAKGSFPVTNSYRMVPSVLMSVRRSMGGGSCAPKFAREKLRSLGAPAEETRTFSGVRF